MIRFLDTNICIYFLKGTHPLVRNRLMEYGPEDIRIPALVKAELLYGAAKSARQEENETTFFCRAEAIGYTVSRAESGLPVSFAWMDRFRNTFFPSAAAEMLSMVSISTSRELVPAIWAWCRTCCTNSCRAN